MKHVEHREGIEPRTFRLQRKPLPFRHLRIFLWRKITESNCDRIATAGRFSRPLDHLGPYLPLNLGGPTGNRTPTSAVQTRCAPIITTSPKLGDLLLFLLYAISQGESGAPGGTRTRKPQGQNSVGTSNRNRTGTPNGREILSLLCLPFHHRGIDRIISFKHSKLSWQNLAKRFGLGGRIRTCDLRLPRPAV